MLAGNFQENHSLAFVLISFSTVPYIMRLSPIQRSLSDNTLRLNLW